MTHAAASDEAPLATLAALLREPIPLAVDRARTTFDQLAAPLQDRMVLFGAGGLGKRVLAGLRRVGIEPLAFADNRAALWGTRVDEVEVLAPEVAARNLGSQAVFVVTIWHAGGPHRYAHVRDQLRLLGCDRIVPFLPLFWKHSDEFLPYYCHDLPHKLLAAGDDVARAFALFEEERSQHEFLAQVRWRLLGDFDGLPPADEAPQYFAGVYGPMAQEVFVDCGAFDGDTIRAFLAQRRDVFERVLAFEPDPANLRALSDFRQSLPSTVAARIDVSDIAVSDVRGLAHFSAIGGAASGFSSSGSPGAITVRCERLDDILAGTTPTLIKMDIEGAELSALEGATDIIQRYSPVLTICAYHVQDHLWRVPLQISSLNTGYRYFLRPHNEEGWDLVCYAVPASRANGKAGASR